VERHPQPTTIAILGCDTVVGRSLSLLLEGSGYQTTLLDSHPTGVVDELLDGAHLLILTPRVDEGVREAFLGAMGKSMPQKGDMLVIALHTDLEEDLPEKEGVISVPWPCETKDLVEQIEAALLDAPEASTSPPSRDRMRTPEAPSCTRLQRRNPMRLIGGTGSSREVRLPPGYRVDRSDPDVLVLRCPHGTTIVRFSAQGATAEAIEQEARRHHKERNRSA
jgi:hypothetical protein